MAAWWSVNCHCETVGIPYAAHTAPGRNRYDVDAGHVVACQIIGHFVCSLYKTSCAAILCSSACSTCGWRMFCRERVHTMICQMCPDVCRRLAWYRSAAYRYLYVVACFPEKVVLYMRDSVMTDAMNWYGISYAVHAPILHVSSGMS